jgi:rod shape-determining protein MreC
VVGIVYLTSAHYSLVMPMLNSKSNISCSLRGTNFFGNLSWDGADPLYVTLNDIPRHARFKKGDVVITSGHSDVFPEGLFVGKVSKISNSRDGLFYQLKVHLGIDFSQLREVCVVYSPRHAEIMNLQKQADEAQRKEK